MLINIIDAYTYPYTYACIYTYVFIYTYVHNLQRVCSQICMLMSKKHLCNVHTCPCTGAQNTCYQVHATLTAKKCTFIYTHSNMHTHTCAHEHTRTFMTPPNPPATINHVKIFKSWSLRDAPLELVQLWHRTFPPDNDGQVT